MSLFVIRFPPCAYNCVGWSFHPLTQSLNREVCSAFSFFFCLQTELSSLAIALFYFSLSPSLSLRVHSANLSLSLFPFLHPFVESGTQHSWSAVITRCATLVLSGSVVSCRHCRLKPWVQISSRDTLYVTPVRKGRLSRVFSECSGFFPPPPPIEPTDL